MVCKLEVIYHHPAGLLLAPILFVVGKKGETFARLVFPQMAGALSPLLMANIL